jgi:hypothetical protein
VLLSSMRNKCTAAGGAYPHPDLPAAADRDGSGKFAAGSKGASRRLTFAGRSRSWAHAAPGRHTVTGAATQCRAGTGPPRGSQSARRDGDR